MNGPGIGAKRLDAASRPKIVVLGGINIDLIAGADRVPSPGETVTGDAFYTTPGGKGANQAVAAARMGASVKMVGRVGDDAFGAELIEGLRAEGVDVSGVAVGKGEASGVAVILLDAQRQNHIVQVRGANLRAGALEQDTVLAALKDADALMLQLEVPFAVNCAVARAAREAGVAVIWDPAPPFDDMSQLLEHASVITPNQSEALALTGVEVTDSDSARAAAEALLYQGADAVVVKMAEMGAFYSSKVGSGHVESFPVDVVDSVAAGDAFGGALTVSLAMGESLADAVRHGCAAGALAVTRPGAQLAMPRRGEVEELISKNSGPG